MNSRGFRDNISRELEPRLVGTTIVISVMLLLLLLRAWYLQGVRGEHYKQLSENNRMSLVEIKAPRGLIYDRQGRLLVKNMPAFNLYLDLAEVEPLYTTAMMIENLIGVEKNLILERAKNGQPGNRVFINSQLTLKQVAIIESHRIDLPGVHIEPGLQRNYLYDDTASHILGYVGEVSGKQLESRRFENVSSGTIIGKAGIEESYNSILMGRSGVKVVEKNALGVEMRTQNTIDAEPGNDIFLTIDMDLQQLAEELLKDKAGVVVMMDVTNGDILVSLSHPNYPPNLLSRSMTNKQWKAILDDPGYPLNNRAIQGQFPPGSIFKIVVAAAGLETGIIKPEDQIECYGTYRIGNTTFRDWKRGGHGHVDLHKAIVESCDVYFYKLGQELGVDKIALYARKFGLGRPTGINLLSEKSGLIPDKQWKKKVKGERWFPGETVSVSIGQGFVSITPLQAVMMISAVANSGTFYKPRFLREIKGVTAQKTIDISPKKMGQLGISEETLAIIRKALRGVVADKHGTGKKARSDIPIAGKTGTAQVVSLSKDPDNKEVAREFRDHAWFVAYAPADSPKVGVVVLIEHGGHGGAVSAPVAKQLIEAYFLTNTN